MYTAFASDDDLSHMSLPIFILFDYKGEKNRWTQKRLLHEVLASPNLVAK
jgi:hypothetical protein